MTVMELELYEEESIVDVRVPVITEPVTADCRTSDSQTGQSQRIGDGLTDSHTATGSDQDEGLKRRKKTRRGVRGGTERRLYCEKVVTAMLESIVTTVEMDLYEDPSAATCTGHIDKPRNDLYYIY